MARTRKALGLSTMMAGGLLFAGMVTIPAEAAVPAPWQNCTQVNQRYPHGVGRANARDRTSGTPVRNFRRDTALYNTAMRNNRGLDRDRDGVACEKA